MTFRSRVRRQPLNRHLVRVRNAERALTSFHRQSFPGPGTATGTVHPDARPIMQALRAVENADDYVVSADVPGVAPEDLSVIVEEGILTLRGIRKSLDWSEDLSDEDKEANTSRFERSVRFNAEIDPEGVTARSRHGELRVVVPKFRPPAPEVTEVPVHTA